MFFFSVSCFVPDCSHNSSLCGGTAVEPLKNDASFLATSSRLLPIVITAAVHNGSLYYLLFRVTDEGQIRDYE